MSRIDGYVLETEYVQHFSREMAPVWLNFVLALQGVEQVPLHEGFTYCDLGCGQGLSVNIFASCHPEGQFHGIDFNQAHIDGATALASQANLANVNFWQGAFENLDRLPLPDFDFITLHGVYSWVDSRNRRYIIDFIRRKLRPGGIVYVSYNCQPGWANVAPIRQLLVSGAGMSSGPLEERIGKSLDFVSRLESMNLSYFSKNPAAGEFFKLIRKLPVKYLAHEYFNEYWTIFYHADIARDFAEAGLSFAGSAGVGEQFDFLRLSQEQQHFLQGIEDSVARETVKDFAVCPLLRKDILTGRTIPSARSIRPLPQCRFALMVPRDKVPLSATFPRGEAQLDPDLYQPLLAELERQPRSLADLVGSSGLTGLAAEKVEEALKVLLAAGHIVPAVDPSPEAVTSSKLFNYAMIERMAMKMEPLFLSAPVIQSGIQLDWVQRLFLLCELTDNPEPFSFVAEVMRQNNYALVRDNLPLKSWDENLEELRRQMDAFYTGQLPLLRRLGVI